MKWHIKNTNKNQTLLEKLLANRGLRDHRAINNFLNPSLKNLYNPLLLGDMARAIERIKQAIAENERIIVYGDYDVDGITSTAIVFRALTRLKANVSYRLPHRIEDGYGLNEKFIREFASLSVKLVITVDCGISCAKEISLARSFGIDVIITDHHTIPKNPPQDAYAILHPRYKNSLYPFKDLTGAGVALKLAYALLGDSAHEFMDLAALGTIADIAPLIDENRLIVKQGLEMLQNPKWHGLKHLKHYAGIQPDDKIDTHSIEYRIAPRINAAGRISHPYYALQLLLQDDGSKRSDGLAKSLDQFNTRRQSITGKALAEAEEVFAHMTPSVLAPQKILIAHNPNWHSGIIGLIAGKLADKYKLPAVIMNDANNHVVGSCRSPEYFNIMDAVTSASKYLEHFGGHAAAAGFTLKKENLNKFITALKSYAKKITPPDAAQSIEIDAEISQREITFETLELIQQFEPFGTGNPEPVFLLKNAAPQNIKTVGKNKDHLKFALSRNAQVLRAKPSAPITRFSARSIAHFSSAPIEAIGFRLGEFAPKIAKARLLDIVFNLQKNTFNGRTALQINVIDLKVA